MLLHFKSIRWRLPLSYIGVALLAALASGVLMMVTLRNYYRQRELDYLQTNARRMGDVVEQLLQSDTPRFVLADQVVNWSFLLQVRVQVFDTTGHSLADSGLPETQQVMFVSKTLTDTFNTELDPAGGAGMFFVTSEVRPPVDDHIIFRYGSAIAPTGDISFTQPLTNIASPIRIAMPLARSLYGFELEAPSQVTAHSLEVVVQPLTTDAGMSLGEIVVSDGPAYGGEILFSALAAWAAASLLAMLVAGMAGVWVSRQMTRPLLALTQVTEQMASGDLTARAEAHTRNEFGQLGHSFNVMADRVAETIQTLRRFVADAAHELNTPLTALQTNVELAMTLEGAERAPALAQAQAQIERLQSLVTGLLNLSRLENQATPRHTQLDLVAMARTLSEVYASRAEQAELNFDLTLPTQPIFVLGDLEQLHRVFENLLDNAIKFTPASGRVHLAVTLSHEQVVIKIEDTGIGIPVEDRLLLFQRFHRGRNTAGYPGNGLGLAIVRAIVEAHQGEITLDTLVAGTQVVVRLPLKRTS